MKSWVYRLFFGLSFAEGLLALILLFSSRSMERNSWLLGYSLERWMLGSLTLLLVILCGWLAYAAFFNPLWLARFIKRLEYWLVQRGGLLLLTFLLAAGLFLGIWLFGLLARPATQAGDAFLAQFAAELPQRVNALRSGFVRLQPLALWSIALLFQALLALGLGFSDAYLRALRDGRLFRWSLSLLIVLTTVFQWVVLIFRLKTFLLVPGWKWYFYEKIFPASHYAIFALLLGGTAALSCLLLRRSWRQQSRFTRWMLIGLVLWGAALQIGFGFIEGQGFESLRIKYSEGVFSQYARVAASKPPIWASLTEYEPRYAQDWYLGTKPPGVLLVYNLTGAVADWIAPRPDAESRFVQLTTLAAYTYPFLAYLVVAALFAFGRRLIPPSHLALLPGLFYITCPNVILIPLFLDQVLYPLLFVCALILVQQSIQKQSVGLALAAGGAIYTSLYFSFSLLPLFPLACLWIALDAWLNRSTRPLWQGVKLLAALLAGILLLALLARWLLNYDILLRYSHAMIQHRRAKEFVPGLQQVLDAIFLNNTEFVTWTGFPLIWLLLARTLKTIGAFLQKRASRLDALLAAFWITYLALNLFGQTRGEVQRLWLFLVPLVAIYAAEEVQVLFPRKPTGVWLVVGLQLITTLLIFKFQDFYG